MGPIGWPELIVLLFIVLILFGPGKLPDIGNAIGKGIREFRKASNDLEEGLRGDTRRKPGPSAASPEPPAASPEPPAAPPASDTDSTVN
ncbi:MAG TPA: twin-arginine translocase TatA/TatE family subunit [Candidatus Limnocylindria bacterium]|nr:twin-arginine translocase TatA/TatE family subunit [Candidatus Limnocylindria bacterium]